jgi:hypothetical protein
MAFLISITRWPNPGVREITRFDRVRKYEEKGASGRSLGVARWAAASL